MGNITMAERKRKVLLTANLKIALIKCSQELKNPYQVDLLTANNITSTLQSTHGMVLVTLSGHIGDIHS
jgi:hypothetical protein